MNIIGTIIEMSEIQNFKNISKRSLVLKTPGEYGQEIEIDFIKSSQKDNISLLNGFKINQDISIDVNIKGTKWTNPDTGIVRRFINLQGWRVEEANELNAQDQMPQRQEVAAQHDSDDLPF